METALKFARSRTDLARNHFRPVMTALELACPSGRVEIDVWAEDLNECLLAMGLTTPKPRKTVTANRLSVTVTTCRATWMILAWDVSPDVHAKFDPKSLGAANPGGRAGIRNVPDRIASNHDNAFFATAAFTQFINQEAV